MKDLVRTDGYILDQVKFAHCELDRFISGLEIINQLDGYSHLREAAMRLIVRLDPPTFAMKGISSGWSSTQKI
jgi:hypothetical protein